MIWFGESGYIDDQTLSTFRTNLVVLPLVMEYLQYIFIGLGLALLMVALVLKLRQKESVNDAKTEPSYQ